MAKRSDQLLQNPFITTAIQVALLVGSKRADSIRARDKLSRKKAGYMAAVLYPTPSKENSPLARGAGPYMVIN
jgi:hypothetical protein